MSGVSSIISALLILLTTGIRPCMDYTAAKVQEIAKMPEVSPIVFDMSTTARPLDITISAAGDCTMGYDVDFGYNRSYNDVIAKNGYEYPFKNVLDIFKNDDVTVVNLETTFTDADKRAVKEFRFKGEPGYAKILGLSSIEAVNIANNHTHDYLEEGYKDTIENLEDADIGYFGKEYRYIKETKGVKLGFLGYTGWGDSQSVRDTIYSDIHELKGECRIVVVSFHWGVERKNYPNSTQQNLGRFCIDSGADLVLGHHPHVIQGIETYKGKHIVYSMGNFSYGGHKNPEDKDTFIFRTTFRISGKEVYPVDSEIIPCSISSVKSHNNYQPTPLSGSEGERVMERLKKYSSSLKYGYQFQ